MKTKIIISLIFIILFQIVSFSQGIFINAGLFRVNAGQVTIVNNGGWKNNAIVNCVSGSNVNMSGNADQYIDGTNSTAFANLKINNSGSHGVIVNRNIQVLGTLTLAAGHLDLKNNMVDLSTTGTLSGEAETHRIRATDALWNEGGGTGTIRATRNNPSGNVAGLGLDFMPSVALGNNTLIERGCNALQGSGSYTSNYSIFRWYRITPGSSISPLTINQFQYWGGTGNSELNGHVEANLQMFQRVQYWNGSTNPIYWEPRTSTVYIGSDYVSSTTTSNPIMLNYILVTLASTTVPLPVELVNFNAWCDKDFNVLTWQTASEINNAGFYIEKSSSGLEWENIGFVAGNGYANILNSYHFNDVAPYAPITYYRLLQMDNDGNSTYSNVISTTCNKEDMDEEIIPYYSNEQLLLTIKGNVNNSYKIIVTNAIGQLIISHPIQLESTLQTISLGNNLAQGIYYISLISEKSVVSKPLVVSK